MYADQLADAQRLWNKGYPKAKTHDVAVDQKEYQTQLAQLAGVKDIPHVFYDMFFDIVDGLINNPIGFRKYKYTIIDDNTYVKEKVED